MQVWRRPIFDEVWHHRLPHRELDLYHRIDHHSAKILVNPLNHDQDLHPFNPPQHIDFNPVLHQGFHRQEIADYRSPYY